MEGSWAKSDIHVIYPNSQTDDPQFRDNINYMENILKLALKNSGAKYTLSTVSIGNISEKRSNMYLKEKRYNVHWMMTSSENEKELIPVKIPLFKGLIGWRIFIIRRSDEQYFSKITNTQDLAQLKAGLGHSWPDVTILRHSNFNISPMYSAVGRYTFLTQKRCDYFPRSIIEIWNEVDQITDKSLVIEKTIALRYPAAYYFFVSPNEEPIANAIQAGLKKIIKTGEFEQIFNKRFNKLIAKSNLKNRRIFQIENPLFRNDSMLNDPTLWFNPSEYVH